MKEDTEYRATQRARSDFKFWLGSVGAVIVLGVSFYGVYLVRQYISYIGWIIIISVGVLPAVGIVALVVWLVKYILKAEIIEIGPSGNLIRHFGKVSEYHPLAPKEYRAKAQVQKKEEELPVIPTLAEVLKNGLLSNMQLLLGYHLDGTARYGVWDDLRTFVVAGKSRSGKTVTMVFFIVQALLGGAQVWVCDPHYRKKTGLLHVLEPLLPYLKVARTDTEIVSLVRSFKKEMQSRIDGKSTLGHPVLLVVDEWSRLLRTLAPSDVDVLVDTILGCAEEYAGYDGYAMIAGQEWTARESGGKKGGAIRRGFHAIFLHRIDVDYAKYLFTSQRARKVAKNANNTPTGHAHFQDSEGELDYLLIPYYGSEKEGLIEAAQQLQELKAGPEYLQLESGYTDSRATNVNTVNTEVTSKQRTETGVNTALGPFQGTSLDVYSEGTYSEHDTEETAVNVNSDSVEKELIRRMIKSEIPQRKMAYIVKLNGRNYDQFQKLYAEVVSELGK